jgi:ADP-heptose:LPS heptosyltransferase
MPYTTPPFVTRLRQPIAPEAAVRRILVVRRENIGDLILTTPLIASLREAFPQAHIALLANSYNVAVVRHHPLLDAVHAYTKAKHVQGIASRLGARWGELRLMVALRHIKFDDVLLAEPSYAMRNIRLARFITGGRVGSRVIAFEERGGSASGADVWVSKAGDDALHHAELVHRLAVACGAPATKPVPPCLVLASPEPHGAQSAPVADPTATPHHSVGIHISARRPSQRWPVAEFAGLIARLVESGTRVHLFWSPGQEDDLRHPGDDAKAAAILAAIAPRLRESVLPTSTPSLEALMQGLQAVGSVICADGGAMHVAAGLGKPIVALFGDSNPVHWRPWGVPHVVLQDASRDVSAFDHERVFRAWQGLISDCHAQVQSP